MISDSFNALAPYYDTLMASVPYRMWADYLEHLLEMHQGHGRRVLDLATGTGTVALLLAERGYQVTGVDISAPMLEQARRKSQQQGLPVTWLHQDATRLELPAGTFDWCCCLYDSLNYVIGEGALAQVFRGVCRALRPDGLFIFDLNTPYCFEQELFTQRQTSPQAAIRYRWRSHYNRESGLTRVDMVFWTDQGEFRETHYQRAYTSEQIGEWLEQVGMPLLAEYEAYTPLPPGPLTDRIFYVARKLADPA